MTEKKGYRSRVKDLFGNDVNIENYYYEETKNGPDKFHVVFREDVNGEGYIEWMTWYLADEFRITKELVIISIHKSIDAFLDKYKQMEKMV